MVLGVASVYPATEAPAQAPMPTMHVVRGEQRHGLIIDPGASAALMGTETLRAFQEQTLQPLGRNIELPDGRLLRRRGRLAGG